MKLGKATRAIHGRKDENYRGVTYPIYQTSSFGVKNSDEYQKFIADEKEFYIYSRYSNPTIRNVEEKLAHLENAGDCLLFSSGMAAISTTLLTFLKSGDILAASNRLYGMTYRFLRDMMPSFGIQVKFLSEEELYRLPETFPEATAVYFETPINPTTDCLSIPRVVTAAREVGAVTFIDNTFASPINQNPIDLGVDGVLHSVTKYIGGHSDVMAGAFMSTPERIQQVHQTAKAFGGCLNAIEAYLLDRSLKTLKIRVNQQNETALKLARFFEGRKSVPVVHYPGLESSPSNAIACAQMQAFGGMLSIELPGLDTAKIFCDSVKVALNATSLGGAETLVSIPVLTSHIGMSEAELKTAGVTPGMVRISVGLEDFEDLAEDFKQALEKI